MVLNHLKKLVLAFDSDKGMPVEVYYPTLGLICGQFGERAMDKFAKAIDNTSMDNFHLAVGFSSEKLWADMLEASKEDV